MLLHVTDPELDSRPADPERVRLDAITRLTDPATIRYLESMRVSEGWRCAEVGAGTGTIARWLADRVGHLGHVDAIDIDTKYLDEISHPNREVRRQDITQTPLEPDSYDLVHAKILLLHLPERQRVLEEMVAALKPGGWLLIEESDIRSIQRSAPPNPLITRAATALETFFYFGGADPGYGMKLLPAMRSTGLEIVGNDCQLTAVQAGTPEMETISLSFGKLAPMVVKAGLMTQREVDEVFRHLATPSDTVVYTPTTVSVWGRRTRASLGTRKESL
jgi:ubiquinone/menaquinone biosynthesis C-methylase UbiE